MVWQIIVFVVCWCLVSVVAAFLLGRLFRRRSDPSLNNADTLDGEPPEASDMALEQVIPESTAALRK